MRFVGPLKLTAQVFLWRRDRDGTGQGDLLDAIDREGSISAAGRALGMSYRRAWMLVDVMNRCWSDRLVESTIGGPSAGRPLTDAGREVSRRLIATSRRGWAKRPARRWRCCRDGCSTRPGSPSGGRPGLARLPAAGPRQERRGSVTNRGVAERAQEGDEVGDLGLRRRLRPGHAGGAGSPRPSRRPSRRAYRALSGRHCAGRACGIRPTSSAAPVDLGQAPVAGGIGRPGVEADVVERVLRLAVRPGRIREHPARWHPTQPVGP